jgi:hydroxymethylpyrimidine/phosphomethylpyrimidine kinase
VTVPVVLSIAGSDSGGGAGIQADLKAFAAAGVHGTTAITAITAQNTLGVTAVHAVPPDVVEAQVIAVLDDFDVAAVKTGMLGDTRTIEAVVDVLPQGVPLVVDPVMVAESGARLLHEEAEDALRSFLLPRATVVTPNVPEARALARAAEDTPPDQLVRALHALGPRVAIVTGGHRDEATDLFFDGVELTELPGERFADGAAHGSGCTHASTLAARLALGDDPLTAARHAKRVAAQAVNDGLRDLGGGPGPVDVLGVAGRAVGVMHNPSG